MNFTWSRIHTTRLTKMASSVLLFVLVQVLFVSVVRPGNCDNWWNWWEQDDWLQWQSIYESNNILKDVSQDALPLTYLNVVFGDVYVEPGDEISPLDTLKAPKLEWICDPNLYYTVMMLDIDAPGTNKGNQFLLWKVENIKDCNQNTGRTLEKYTSPTPDPATGAHRLFIILFEQAAYKDRSIVDQAVQGTAGTLDYSTDFYIKMVGRSPWAGNFFYEKSPLVSVSVLHGADSNLPLGEETKVLVGVESKLK